MTTMTMMTHNGQVMTAKALALMPNVPKYLEDLVWYQMRHNLKEAHVHTNHPCNLWMCTIPY